MLYGFIRLPGGVSGMASHLYIFGSVFAVSLIAFIGVLSLSVSRELLNKVVFALVSFAAGAMFGGAFLHLLPKTAELFGFGTTAGMYILSGIVSFFIIDKYIHWHHHHFREEECDDCAEPFTYMILIGYAFHNLIDGIVIAGSYLAGVSVGLATTLAVALHEIPQEIGDFGVLIHGGFSVKKALGYNFLSALTAVLGAVLVLGVTRNVAGLNAFLLPFAAGGFIYIAGTDLLPEFKEETGGMRSAVQMATFILGIAAMYLLKLGVQRFVV
jgi:zinc and cadmium transporter